MVVNDPRPSGARAIRVYICDGDGSAEGDAEWFTGIIRGDTFNLTYSDGDANIQGQLTEAAATGTVSLPDGRTLSFRAVPARKGGGFYDVFLLANGTKQGVSSSGATHTSRVISERVQGNKTIKILANIIRTLDGKIIRYRSTFTVLRPTEEQALAIIVLPNASAGAGAAAGSSRRGAVTSHTTSLSEAERVVRALSK